MKNKMIDKMNEEKTQLTIEKVAPYLPYGLEYWSNNLKRKRKMKVGNIESIVENSHSCWLILHPLSDLSKKISVNGKKLIPTVELVISALENISGVETIKIGFHDIDGFTLFGEEKNGREMALPYFMYQKLFQWHFDIFGLIDQGLAIDINELKQ